MERSLERYVTEYEKARHMRPGGEPARLARIHEDAFSRFISLGFPTTRDEEWRFTSVAPIAERTFALSIEPPADTQGVDIAPFRLSGGIQAELVFVNGQHVSSLSTTGVLPRGMRVESLKSSLAAYADELDPHLARVAPLEPQAFAALNTALFTDGAYIQVPARAIVEKPIHVLFVSTGEHDGRTTMAHPRVLVVLGDNSQASIVESYVAVDGGRYFTNAVTEVVVGENATLNHYKLQQESVRSYHVGALYVQARRHATCACHSVSVGGALVRNDVAAVLDGEGAECALNGLYLATEQRLVDNHTTIDHAKPHCGSRELYKGILADHARGVFNGKIIVRPDAQKTDAKQTNRALLLSEDAQINTKPQLEIFANDVKCTHGAAVGQLDDEAVFYLRSRGLDASEARRMLIHAFAADVMSRMPLDAVRTIVDDVLQRQLAGALPAAA